MLLQEGEELSPSSNTMGHAVDKCHASLLTAQD